jgi:hypothetical protein
MVRWPVCFGRAGWLAPRLVRTMVRSRGEGG